MNALSALPCIEDQTAFNLNRWEVLCADPELARLDYRMETDRHGNILMNFPADYSHGATQFDIGKRIETALPHGQVSVECPISTSEGVKAADVAWGSKPRLAQIGGRAALQGAPEICVEVVSRSNTRNEIEAKRRLYFEAGAEEVWVCERSGALRFFLKAQPDSDAGSSALCPQVPNQLG